MIVFDSKQFKIDMTNIVDYSIGFLDGIEGGKTIFFKNLGYQTKELAEMYIDSMAKMDPASLHHVYEWYRTGSPDGRLFHLHYTVSNLGLSFKSTFSQSKSVKSGSNTPFYNKAKIMENGTPVVIEPKRAEVLSFDVDGQTIFTKGPVVVNNPGGVQVQGSFERSFDSFFSRYLSQALLKVSGVEQYLKNPVVYKRNLSAGKRGGKSTGYNTGFRWIANAGVA
jgi:hypothetical protein